MIRASIIYNMKQELPNIDVSENSPTDDLIIKPNIAVQRRLLEKVNEMDLARNLDYAEYLSEDYLDQIIEGNFLIRRKAGMKASTIVTIHIAAVGGESTLIVPAGIAISTKDMSKRFQVSSRLQFSSEQLPLYLNQETMEYEVPVFVEAVDKGSSYNTDENTLVLCETYFNSNFISVTNTSKVSNGKDKESNKSYAERARNYYLSRHLGTDGGYKEFVREVFDEATDVFVAGKNSPYMTRDLLSFKNASNETVTRHMGGMTDIYIKGCYYDTRSEDVVLKTGKLILSEEFSKIDQASIRAFNTTDASKIPVISQISEFTDPATSKVKMALDIGNALNVSYDPSIISDLYVSYKINKGTAEAPDIEDKIDNFQAGDTVVELESPLKDIVSLEDVLLTTTIDNPQNIYDIIREGTVGTTQEKNRLVFKNISNYYNGYNLKLNYTINDTLNTLSKILDMESSRIIADDVLGYEAKPVYVNISIEVKMKADIPMDRSVSLKLQSVVADYFGSAKLGTDIHESDIINKIYEEKELMQYFDYINIPFKAFYVVDNVTGPVEEIRDGTNLDIDRVAYPVLNKFIATPVAAIPIP